MSTHTAPSDNLKQLQSKYGAALDDVLTSRLAGAGDPVFFGMMRYQFGYVDEGLQPLVAGGGKRFRPLLCLLACESAGGEWAEALHAAAAIELLHNFSLIHDDIEDRDPSRRHRPTVWKIWGEAQAINVGDAVFAEAVRTMLAAHADPRVCLELSRRFGDVVLLLTEGQYMDMSFETQSNVTPAQYMAMIERKTAELIGFSLWAGAEISGAGEQARRSLFQFGLELGKAFQIHDDIMGIWGASEVTGKQAAMDLLNRKKTLPVLIAFERTAPRQRATLDAFFRHESDDCEEVLALLEQTGARAQAESHITRVMARAEEALEQAALPGKARATFEAIACQLTGGRTRATG